MRSLKKTTDASFPLWIALILVGLAVLSIVSGVVPMEPPTFTIE